MEKPPPDVGTTTPVAPATTATEPTRLGSTVKVSVPAWATAPATTVPEMTSRSGAAYTAVKPVSAIPPEVLAKAGAVVATVTAGIAHTAPRTAARLLSTVDPMRA